MSHRPRGFIQRLIALADRIDPDNAEPQQQDEPGTPDADPAAEDHSKADTAPAEPAARVRGGGRLPDWRTGQTADLTAPAPNQQPAPAADDQDHDAEPTANNEGDTTGQTPAPVEKKEGKLQRNASRRVIPLQHVHGNDTLRWCAFNGAAAGIGYYCGLVHQVGQWLPAAEHAANGTLGTVFAITGVYAAWKLTGRPAVYDILPAPAVTRLIAVLGAAELGRRSAPMAVDWLNAHGAHWGLGPDAVSLLLTAGGISGGLYWFLDRRARTHGWPWAARFAARIPLASALLATGLYAPGT